jgi:hypothetical protein
VVDWLAERPAGVLFVGLLLVSLVLALGFTWLAERAFDADARGRTSGSVTTAVGVIAGLYAVLVAFVIVNQWQAFADAQSKTSDESAALAATYASASPLGEPARTQIQGAVLRYVNTVVCDEFPHLQKHTDPDPRAVTALFALYGVVARNSTAQPAAFYSNIVSELNNVVTARRSRINAAASRLPNLLLAVIVVTSIALIATISALDTRHRRWHFAITAVLTVIVALNLTLILSLDRPFAGAAKVSDDPFREGVPAAALVCKH